MLKNVLMVTLAKISQNIFACSFVSEKKLHFLAGGGVDLPHLADSSAKNASLVF